MVADRPVVLLGERHDSPEHHRWQLQVLSSLLVNPEPLVIALEMFPRSAQPILDRWVNGELGEKEFFRLSGWSRFWRFDPDLYAPLFHFARMNRVPMVAMNLEAGLSRKVSQKGFDGVPELVDEGITRPAPAPVQYRDFLRSVHQLHGNKSDEESFQRFVESQLTWDRAMAQAILAVLQTRPGNRVVGVLGSGHVINGWGVAHQLGAMGGPEAALLLPSDAAMDCASIPESYATAMFGVASPAPSPERQQLGVWLEVADQHVFVREVMADSLGASAGLKAGDILLEIAGQACSDVEDVVDRVRAQAPGSWLPLKVRRGTRILELVAKFPASG